MSSKQVGVLTSPSVVSSKRAGMALAGLLFPILGCFFIALWGFLGLLKVAVTILTHPFTALKKTTRESENAILFV